jgi:murein DD-endopeptidase MepM/ murein hydrolase activator NlpD
VLLQSAVCLGEFVVVTSFGDVVWKRGSSKYTRVRKKETLRNGDTIRTGRDSAVVLKNGKGYFKLYAYSKATLRHDLMLAHGKYARSENKDFLDLRFYFSPLPSQGHTMKVVLRPSSVVTQLNSSIKDEGGFSQAVDFFQVSERIHHAFIGFDIEMPPARYSLVIRCEDEKKRSAEIVYPFYLKPTRQLTGKVFLKKQMRDLLEPSAKKSEEQRLLYRILTTKRSSALWEQKFIYPVENPRIVSPFGKRRLYYIENTLSFVRFHRGVDFKGSCGDPVIAPNNGVIVFADMRITTGYTVVIDHGQGVFSLFFHLSSIEAFSGNFVEKGEKIGEIGDTGIVEGSHLHWGIWVNGVYVDPLDWIKKEF